MPAESSDDALIDPPVSEATGKPASNIRINAPLDFTLKGLESNHPYLIGRGFTPKTIWRFGLGYCARGLMAGRVAIPLHDENGHLVGYAGRLVDDDLISEDTPKYKFPSQRERDGVFYDFRKSHLLYNANRIKGKVDHLVVVEGFPSVWWLDQAGIHNVVAVMGSSCSQEQAAIMFEKSTAAARISVLADGDVAGSRCAHSVFDTVGSHRWMRWILLERSRQPTDCSPRELKHALMA